MTPPREDGDPPVPGWDSVQKRPTWVSDSDEMPDPNKYQSSECYVAGALSTMEPFRSLHPAWCLPFARRALDALGDWNPDDDGGGVPSGGLHPTEVEARA